MGYYLNAIVSSSNAMEVIVEQYEHAFPHSIGLDLVILPHVTPYLPSDDTKRFGYDDHFWYLDEPLVSIILRASELSPVSHVEAEYAGGVGGQAAIVWSNSKVVYGPEQVTNRNYEGRAQRVPKQTSPISQALRHLGVQAIGAQDEFDTVRLGRFRHTLAWLPQEWRDEYADY
jgi:hypothetical protein